jgi:catechol 2,3-dioxygenase-like lactoylglutathione lyase family enzyme
MARANHHVALQVANLERAVGFYAATFDARWLSKPVLFDDSSAAVVMGGPVGTAFRHCKVGFDEGAVELFEFVGDRRPAWAEAPRGVPRLPHFAIVVEDVPATLARVRAAGGTELWPSVTRWGTAENMYVADLDGNVIEVIDAPLDDVVATTIRMFPEADPAASGGDAPS